MHERAPIDVALARRNLLRPAEYRQIVFDRMFRGFASPERLDRTESILDAVRDDASSLRRSASLADPEQVRKLLSEEGETAEKES